AQDQRAGDLGKEAAGAVVLDQQHEVVAWLERASLQMTRRERRALADRRRRAEENVLLAAEHLAFMLRQRRHVDVAQPRLDPARDLGEHSILHFGAALDQAYSSSLLIALSRSTKSVASANVVPA